MINQVELKLTRRKPVRHPVRSHTKKNGSHVRDYERGSGMRASRSSKVVGVGNNTSLSRLYDEKTSLEFHGHIEDFIELLKEFGFKLRSPTLSEMKSVVVDWPIEEVEDMFERQKQEVCDGIRVGGRSNPVILYKKGKAVKWIDIEFP